MADKQQDFLQQQQVETIDSVAFFRIIWRCVIATGLHGRLQLRQPLAILYRCWGLFLQVFFMFGFPFHLALATFQSPNMDVNIRNFSMMIICVVCVVKYTLNMHNIDNMHEVERLWRLLDERITDKEDRLYFQRLHRTIRGISSLFLFFYFSLSITGQLSVMSKDENTLMFNARFPFDWRASNFNYRMANLYQVSALTSLLLLNYVNDCYPPITLFLLTEHMKLLARRFSRIGHRRDGVNGNGDGRADDNVESRAVVVSDGRVGGFTTIEYELELLRCIRDHKIVLRLHDTLQGIHKWSIFLQFTITAFTICVGMVALMFYAEDVLDRFYYFVYFVCTTLEILPVCYYGTHLDYIFQELPGSVYLCNWIEQTRSFKKNMIFFTERSLKPNMLLAGNMFRINLSFFMSTIKGAYSLFTILSTTKSSA